MDNVQGTVKMEVPFFQTPNNIFDLNITVKAHKVKKEKDNRIKEVISRPLKSHEKLVYIYFCRCANNGGRAFPSYNTIAKKCGISRVTAIEAVSVLKDNKLIIKKDRKKSIKEQDSNEYLVLPPSTPDLPQSSKPSIPPSTPDLPRDSKPDILPSTPGVPKKEPYKKNYIKKEPYKKIYSSIITYLNKKANTNYRATTKKTKQLIQARLEEEFTLEDFNTVIDKKCSEWLNTEFERYLRPETLFGNKFENYLNQKIVSKKTSTTGDSFNNYQQRDYDFDDLEKKLLGWENEEDD